MRVVPLLLLSCAVASPAPAATLRTATSLSTRVVLVSDLFDEAGTAATRVLGPAPAPGERIVVEAAQLAAIARAFNVDWRPASSADRAVLDRPGRPLPRQVLLDAIGAALADAGAPALNEIDLPDVAAPMIPLAAQPQAVVEELDYRRESGRFTADLLVSGATMEPLRLRLSGNVEAFAMIPVPTHRLAAGSILRPDDLAPTRTRLAMLRGDVVRDAAAVLGMALRRPAQAGQPVAVADLERPAAVAKGARVKLELHTPGLAVAAQGLALMAGAVGDRIQVLNPDSHLVIEGVVLGPDTVAVAPDSAPLPSDARNVTALADAR